jgi:AcrR family transcriptional regulator
MKVDRAVDPGRGGQATGGRVLSTRGQRTRAALVAAAAAIFEETPFSEVRLVDIAARAGVAAGTFYTYFDSKEQIFREVAASVLAEMSNAPRRASRSADTDPRRAIADATRAYFLCCLRHATVARSIEQLNLRDEAVADVRRSTIVTGVKRAERWIRRLQTEGICDDRIDAWYTAMVLHTMNVRVAYDHLLTGGDQEDVEHLVEAVTHVWARTVGLEQASPRLS